MKFQNLIFELESPVGGQTETRMNMTEMIARFVRETRFEDLPSQTIANAKTAFLDWLGVTVGGSLHPASLLLRNTLFEFRGPAQATIVGHGEQTDVLTAALLNGYFSHVLDYDDVHLGLIGHPSAPVFPAVLALSEWKDVGGKDFICAFVLGVEVECRLGEAVNPNHYNRGWHSTSTLGHFGAAVGASKILGLDTTSVVHALGTAGTQAAGLRQVFGTMCKALHPGKAATNGLLAAILAEKGFTSSEAIIDGQKGFTSVLSDEYDPNALVHNLGQDWKVDQIIFKRHASCYRTHAVIECTLALRKRLGDGIDRIRSIHCKVPPLAWDVAGILMPENALEAKFSQPFCMAVALLTGQAVEAQFTRENVQNHLVKKLIEQTTVEVLPHLRSTEAAVEVILQDGTTVHEQVDTENMYPPEEGIPSELISKFRGLMPDSAAGEEVDTLIESIVALEGARDMGRVAGLIPCNP